MKKITIARPLRVEAGSEDLKLQSQSSDTSRRNKLEDILSYFIYENCVCRQCGKNHSYNLEYENVRSNIRLISDLF